MIRHIREAADYWRAVKSGAHVMPLARSFQVNITIDALDDAILLIAALEQKQRQAATNCSDEPQTVLYRWRKHGKMNWITSPFPPLGDGVEVQELIVRPKHG